MPNVKIDELPLEATPSDGDIPIYLGGVTKRVRLAGLLGIGQLRTVAARTLLGNPTGSSATPTEITATVEGHVLRRASGVLGFGTIGSGGLDTGSVTGPKIASSVISVDKLDDNAGSYATATLARAAADALPVGRTVYTLGALVKGDGGGGEWEVVLKGALVDNLGTRLVGSVNALVRKSTAFLTPEMFGAKGDNATDDFIPFRDMAAEKQLMIIGAKTYWISAGVKLESDLKGLGQSRTTCLATTVGQAHLFELTGRATVSDTFFHGGSGRRALCCLYLHNANGVKVFQCGVEFSKFDGILLSRTGNNNNVSYDSCLIRNNGTVYSTGTVTGSEGASTVVVVGAVDLTTIGLREGADYVTFDFEIADSNAKYAISKDPADVPYAHEITAITANSITFYPPLQVGLPVSAYAIRMGSGIRAQINDDNGRGVALNCIFQDNAVAGYQDQSLYASTFINCTFEYNTYGYIVGRRDFPDQVRTVAWKHDQCYGEANLCGDICNAHSIKGIYIPGPEFPTTRIFSGSWPAQRLSDEVTFYAVAGASYTPNIFFSIDNVTRLTNAAQVAVELTTDVNQNFPIGSRVRVLCAGAGGAIVSAAGGVTLTSEHDSRTFAQGSYFELIKRDSNVWFLTGAPVGATQLSFAVAGAPAASSMSGALAHVTNGDAGRECVARSNGTDWIVLDTGRAISALVSDGINSVPTAATYLVTHAANYGRRHTELTGIGEIQLPTTAEDASWKQGDVVTFYVVSGTPTVRVTNATSKSGLFTTAGAGSWVVATRMSGDAWRFSGDLA